MVDSGSRIEDVMAVMYEAQRPSRRVFASRRFRGLKERAMLRGEEVFFYDAVVRGCRVVYRCGQRSFTPLLYVDFPQGGGSGYIMWPSRSSEFDWIYFVLTRHAVVRWWQRYVKHDEAVFPTEAELEECGARLREECYTCGMGYDKVTGAWMLSVTGGALIAVINEEQRVLVLMTFIAVSQMRVNQRLARGVGNRASNEAKMTLMAGSVEGELREMKQNDTIARLLKDGKLSHGDLVRSPKKI